MRNLKGYKMTSFGDSENCKHRSTQPLDDDSSECQCGAVVCDDCGAGFEPIKEIEEKINA